MKLAYRIVNVFTQGGNRLTGNPLCVFEDGSGLDTDRMQALALQFNLSETSFVMPSAQADARVRIFSPSYEMPFAGHPTLGTAHVVRSLKGLGAAVNLELNVGVIPVSVGEGLFELRSNRAAHRAPRASKASLAHALGLGESDLGGAPLWMDSGTEQLIVPLASEDAARRARPSFDALSSVTSDGKRPNAYLFAKTGPATLFSRFFFSKGDVLFEDPATGSATANLGGWYLANQAEVPLSITISQGEMTGRPSTLRLRIDAQGNVFVAGEVIELGRGEVEL
jgi:trans-2,3-dihydro-3-hydroxyanthranilate isomerase